MVLIFENEITTYQKDNGIGVILQFNVSSDKNAESIAIGYNTIGFFPDSGFKVSIIGDQFKCL
ncbi:UNVERIFIED_CONTAM: hypothetical protein NCL1_13071 [Trichonephila clavipes]